MADSLFSASASDERKHWGFSLASKVIRKAPEEFIPSIFSPNFMRCLINQLALPERFLHRVALKVLKAIHSRAEAEPSTTLFLVVGLMGSNGVVNFDQATKTKTIEKLLVQSSVGALQLILSHLGDFIRHPGVKDEKAAESRRQLLADQLLSTVRSRKLEETDMTSEGNCASWIYHVFLIFINFAYPVVHLGPDSSPSPPISKATQSLLRSRISSCLVHLMSTPQGAVFPNIVVSNIHAFADEDSEQHFLFQADDAVRKDFNRAWKMVEKIHTKVTSAKAKKRAYLKAFELLYSLTILQVYNGDTDAILVLDELNTCYDSLVKHSSAENDEASELLVEVLLSFVSKPSVLFRKMAELVFTTFSSEITAPGLEAMIEVLKPLSNTLSYVNKLTKSRFLRPRKVLQVSRRYLMKSMKSKKSQARQKTTTCQTEWGLLVYQKRLRKTPSRTVPTIYRRPWTMQGL
jgi:DNA polymerase phi